MATDVDVPVLPGNWLAHQIRGLQEDTRGMLNHVPRTPESEASGYGPYMSLFEITYGPRAEILDRGNERKKFRVKRREVRPSTRTHNFPHPSKMFMKWKVPTRLVDEYTAAAQGKTIHHQGNDPAREEIHEQLAQLNIDPAKNYAVPRTDDPTQTTHHSPSMHALHDKIRKAGSALPDIAGARPKSQSAASVASSQRSVKSATQAQEAGRIKTPAIHRAKTEVQTPEIWKRQYSKSVIDKAIRQSGRFADMDRTLHKALLPDAKQAAQKWLSSASEQDRKVALQFFQSVAGTKLMGTTTEEQMNRLDMLLKQLSRGQPIGAFLLPRYKGPGKRRENTKLQYVRLLSPNTRQSRPMHTTWHHLPVYPDQSRVENKSSHYTEPHKHISRHFVIHPDWG